MSVIRSILDALAGVDFTVKAGKFPKTENPCGKIVFINKPENEKTEKRAARFLGGGKTEVGAFKVILRGDEYETLEQMENAVKNKFKLAGFAQIGGYEDIESKDDAYVQLAVSFKFIKKD